MALVFKIKFQDTLRRWVICQNFSEAALFPTFQQLDVKIRELFHLASTASIVITYVDKDNDVVTLAEDDELLDACLEQWLNPLHLHVKVHEELQNISASQSTASADSSEDGNVDTILRAVPRATADSKKQRFPQANEPKLPPVVPLGNAHNAANEFLKALTRESGWEMDDGYQASPAYSENRTHDPHVGHPDTGHSSPLRCQGGKGASICIVHRGVQCDSCGMSPIEGSRFMSKRIFNNDLCSSCFEAFGNEVDYQRIEHPGHVSSDILHNPPCAARGRRHHTVPPPCRPSFARGPYGWQPEGSVCTHLENFWSPGGVGGKLDARFVKDMTIFDGTELTPCTKFTKIWRLTNNGTIPWPQNTHLVHIGGDMLSSQQMVKMEIPAGGIACGDDADASVDLIAPEEAGHYVSYWCLLSPSGQKFGHRLWVGIQVIVSQGEQSPQLQGYVTGEVRSQEGKAAVVTSEEGIQEPCSYIRKERSVLTSVPRKDGVILECHEGKDEQVCDLGKSIDKLVIIKAAEQGSTKECSTDTAGVADVPVDFFVNENGQFEYHGPTEVMSSELDGFSVVGKPVEIVDVFINQETFLQGKPIQISTEQEVKLQLLESMGYTDNVLNADLLEKNNQNLELTIDDLDVAAGWDDILAELQEMGFDDKSTNRRLLIKNQGSMKWVVKQLVQMEKQKVGQM